MSPPSGAQQGGDARRPNTACGHPSPAATLALTRPERNGGGTGSVKEAVMARPMWTGALTFGLVTSLNQ